MRGIVFPNGHVELYTEEEIENLGRYSMDGCKITYPNGEEAIHGAGMPTPVIKSVSVEPGRSINGGGAANLGPEAEE